MPIARRSSGPMAAAADVVNSTKTVPQTHQRASAKNRGFAAILPGAELTAWSRHRILATTPAVLGAGAITCGPCQTGSELCRCPELDLGLVPQFGRRSMRHVATDQLVHPEAPGASRGV